MSYDLCSGDANIGFPINIAGKLTQTDLGFKSIQASPDVYIAFGTMKERRFISNKVDSFAGFSIYDNSNTTINYNGISYKLISIQICKATHSGSQWPMRSGQKNDYDMAMTFIRESGEDGNNPATFLFIIPIYTKTTKSNSAIKESSVAKDFFTDLVKNTIDSLSSVPLTNFVPKFTSYDTLFNDLASKQYVYYQSCLTLRPPPINNKWTVQRQQVGVCLFVGGWVIDDFDTIMKRYTPYINVFRYVQKARKNYFTAKRLPPIEGSTDALNFIRGGDNWSPEGEIAGNSISVGDTQFTKRFRWISEGIAGIKSAQRLKTTLEYQCVPLNKLRDVDGQLVLLDPLTGTRALKEEIDGSAAEKSQLDEIEKSKNSMRNIAIFLGSVLAIIVLIVGGSFLVRALLNRSNTPEGTEAIAAAAVALGTISATSNKDKSKSGESKQDAVKPNAPVPPADTPKPSPPIATTGPNVPVIPPKPNVPVVEPKPNAAKPNVPVVEPKPNAAKPNVPVVEPKPDAAKPNAAKPNAAKPNVPVVVPENSPKKEAPTPPSK